MSNPIINVNVKGYTVAIFLTTIILTHVLINTKRKNFRIQVSSSRIFIKLFMKYNQNSPSGNIIIQHYRLRAFSIRSP